MSQQPIHLHKKARNPFRLYTCFTNHNLETQFRDAAPVNQSKGSRLMYCWYIKSCRYKTAVPTFTAVCQHLCPCSFVKGLLPILLHEGIIKRMQGRYGRVKQTSSPHPPQGVIYCFSPQIGGNTESRPAAVVSLQSSSQEEGWKSVSANLTLWQNRGITLGSIC